MEGFGNSRDVFFFTWEKETIENMLDNPGFMCVCVCVREGEKDLLVIVVVGVMMGFRDPVTVVVALNKWY